MQSSCRIASQYSHLIHPDKRKQWCVNFGENCILNLNEVASVKLKLKDSWIRRFKFLRAFFLFLTCTRFIKPFLVGKPSVGLSVCRSFCLSDLLITGIIFITSSAHRHATLWLTHGFFCTKSSKLKPLVTTAFHHHTGPKWSPIELLGLPQLNPLATTTFHHHTDPKCPPVNLVGLS